MNVLDWQTRTKLLLGEENVKKLKSSHILIAGVGGVGGYIAEQLSRAGIGKLTLVDNDIVQPSNRNRQIIAMQSTENQYKTELFAKRLKDINPEIQLKIYNEYIQEDNTDMILDNHYDYVADAIDTLSPKVNLLVNAYKRNMKIISSMGAAGKTDPTKIEICDISKSHHCKFAYIVRKYLHRREIFKGITVVYSPETVSKRAIIETNGENNKRSVVGTISYMPAVFGCYCSFVIIEDLIRSK